MCFSVPRLVHDYSNIIHSFILPFHLGEYQVVLSYKAVLAHLWFTNIMNESHTQNHECPTLIVHIRALGLQFTLEFIFSVILFWMDGERENKAKHTVKRKKAR